ncbi:hypothetical protein HZF05_16370 [Sphingomonas sp. CGMCC 1.13654]|uniref:TnsA endonuclease N-terminal domain-containing protein n=1 Tax=Sphingomonas chungangi TaxID=2683589 RepID=A0A838L9T9_9SPHN|nr:TnsA endonuclease N-terminal domain-containing protein [Sphingomonas chungangi]MBA2935660.1 hypothetical protein [Sphingomonas chungangi]MVW54351.1 hypothetical protein [Sphingomonas chungangi]
MVRNAINLIPDRTDPAYRPSPRALRRILCGEAPIRYGDRIARITVLEHGGHRRPVIHRGSKHSRFRFTSRKTGLTQLGEGRIEEFCAYRCETDGDVVDYQCHPFEIETICPDGPFSYRPDLVLQRRDGPVELIELKRTPDDIDDPEYRERLATIREVVRRVGWRFRILYAADVYGETDEIRRQRLRNVESIFGHRSLKLSANELRTAQRLVGRGSAMTWRVLRDAVAPGDPLAGNDVVESLLARGVIVTDVDLPFHHKTVLEPVRPFRGPSLIRL